MECSSTDTNGFRIEHNCLLIFLSFVQLISTFLLQLCQSEIKEQTCNPNLISHATIP